jgi:ketosteroid isomerase-like protein
MKSFAIVLLSLVVSCSCVAQTAHDEESIRSIRSASNKAIAASDIAGFAASLEPGFVVVTGNGSFLSREAYVAAFAKDFEDPHSVRFERIVDSIDISTSVPLAAEHGHWVGRLPGGPVIFSGTYLAMWRRSETGWKLRSELFVSLACSDMAACESYRKKYGAGPPTPGQPKR